MKKSLIALAVMAAAGAASAQSSVTLFGIVDASISHYRGENHFTGVEPNGYNSSRLGFRGTEDLGGGLSASFWLEGQLLNDTGSGAAGGAFDFKRRSTVSLSSSSWGELRIGRDYAPTFWNLTVFDPFGTNGVGTNVIQKARAGATGLALAAGAPAGSVVSDPNEVRASNSVGYFLPAKLGGFYGQAMYAWDEIPGGNDSGRYMGARLGYGSGPFNVALAYGRTDGTEPAALVGGTPDVTDWNIGGTWDFGMAKVMAQYDHANYDTAGGDATMKGWLIGALVPVGAGEIRASYSRVKLDVGSEPRVGQWALGYVHNLSKRTALYATYAHVSNDDGAALPVNGKVFVLPNGNSQGFDVGIRHSF